MAAVGNVWTYTTAAPTTLHDESLRPLVAATTDPTYTLGYPNPIRWNVGPNGESGALLWNRPVVLGGKASTDRIASIRELLGIP